MVGWLFYSLTERRYSLSKHIQGLQLGRKRSHKVSVGRVCWLQTEDGTEAAALARASGAQNRGAPDDTAAAPCRPPSERLPACLLYMHLIMWLARSRTKRVMLARWLAGSLAGWMDGRITTYWDAALPVLYIQRRRARSEIFLTVCTRPLQQDIIRKHTRPAKLLHSRELVPILRTPNVNFATLSLLFAFNFKFARPIALTQEVSTHEESADFNRICSCWKYIRGIFILVILRSAQVIFRIWVSEIVNTLFTSNF